MTWLLILCAVESASFIAALALGRFIARGMHDLENLPNHEGDG